MKPLLKCCASQTSSMATFYMTSAAEMGESRSRPPKVMESGPLESKSIPNWWRWLENARKLQTCLAWSPSVTPTCFEPALKRPRSSRYTFPTRSTYCCVPNFSGSCVQVRGLSRTTFTWAIGSLNRQSGFHGRVISTARSICGPFPLIAEREKHIGQNLA